MARFDSIRLRIGLVREVAALVRQARDGEISGLADSVVRVLERPKGRSVFADGTLVETEWDAALETQDWDG